MQVFRDQPTVPIFRQEAHAKEEKHQAEKELRESNLSSVIPTWVKLQVDGKLPTRFGLVI